jgi:hypothetical protein
VKQKKNKGMLPRDVRRLRLIPTYFKKLKRLCTGGGKKKKKANLRIDFENST